MAQVVHRTHRLALELLDRIPDRLLRPVPVTFGRFRYRSGLVAPCAVSRRWCARPRSNPTGETARSYPNSPQPPHRAPACSQIMFMPVTAESPIRAAEGPRNPSEILDSSFCPQKRAPSSVIVAKAAAFKFRTTIGLSMRSRCSTSGQTARSRRSTRPSSALPLRPVRSRWQVQN